MNNKTSIVTLIVVAIIAISVVTIGRPVLNVSPTPVTVNVPEQKAPIVNVAAPDLSGVRIPAPVVNVESPRVLGSSGSSQNTLSRQFFDVGLTQGGVFSTTTIPGLTTYKLTAGDLNSSVIQWNNGVNMTINVGSSTAAIVPKAGDVARVWFLNASTTAGSAITFAAVDSNVDLQFTEATGGDLVLNGLDWAELTFIRQISGKVTVIFNEFTEAD